MVVYRLNYMQTDIHINPHFSRHYSNLKDARKRAYEYITTDRNSKGWVMIEKLYPKNGQTWVKDYGSVEKMFDGNLYFENYGRTVVYGLVKPDGSIVKGVWPKR